MSVTKTQIANNPRRFLLELQGGPLRRRIFAPHAAKFSRCRKARTFSRFSAAAKTARLTRSRSKSEFHKLSWKLHPDNFMRATEHERNLSLERSSQLNDAYRTLRDPLARIEYLLLRLGLRKEGATKQQAPPELLEEVFEFNESLDELREARAEGGDVASLARTPC